MAKKQLEFLVQGVFALRAHAGSILVFAALACACESWGQAVEPPNVQSLDRQQAEQERLKKMLQGVPKAYLDKVMVPGELPSMDDDGTIAADSLADGYRTYFSESRFNTARGSADGTSLKSTSELGQSVGVRGESLNYGDYEFTADLRTSKGPGLALSSFRATESTGSRFTLRNTAFPSTCP